MMTEANPRKARPLRRNLPLALLGLTAACATASGPIAPIATMAIDAGRKLLMDTAEENFGSAYNEQFSKMIDLMMLRTVAGQEAGAGLVAGRPVSPEGSGASAPSADASGAETGSASAGYGQASEPSGSYAATSLEPIELEVIVVREVVLDDRPVPVAVEDGGVLRDGVGRDGDGDNLKIRFEVNVECYVYAVWVDATAWATPIFPSASGSNPVAPDTLISIPGGNDWFYLDDYRGVENLYFVASHQPLEELDSVLLELAGKERSFRIDSERPAIVDQPGELTRGLAGIREGQAPVTASDGVEHPVASQAFIAQAADADLVVTRWFRHE